MTEPHNDSPTPTAEILIVSWNGRNDTIRAIESIHPQIGIGAGRVANVKITIVDNGSTDHTAEIVSRRFPTVGIVKLPENRGFTGGVAAGAAQSTANYLILVNNDAVAEPGWLEALVESIESAPDDVVAISGRIVDLDGRRADFVGGVVTFDGHGFQPGFHKPLDRVREPETGDDLLFACGGNMIVRREAFDDLDGLDDDYFAYLEDVDFGWRAWLSGYRITYSREAAVRHHSSATSVRLGNYERGVLFEKNAAMTVLKNLEEEVFREMAGPILLTLFHREHGYIVGRHDHGGVLSRPPLGQTGGPSERIGWWSRLLERLRPRSIRLDDPLAIMQIRAIEWLLSNMDRIMDRRERVQQKRRRTDREIFERFPMVIVPTYPGDETLFGSALFEALRPVLPFEIRSLEEMTED